MMHPESQVPLEIHTPSTENTLMYAGDYNFHSSTSVPTGTCAQKPGPRRTRQWAAWTRQEQENFFNALRQVGKNFEKITCRVQSKNKNQVRHYYYRLVRRMNKLLSPGFCLDAKNSKDTNAAMLRWWSLLEKYSCTPSKMHRKPRRFKIFIEALENQLLKDRNKAKRKRPCQGESCLESSSSSSFLRRFSEQDFCGVKAIVSSAEDSQKIGINKGASLKRNTNSNFNFSKGVLSAMKATGQKQRTGLVESAAYKRWEKAAMAGVSLVADAAEQLERATKTRNCSFDQDMHAFSALGACSHQIGHAVMQPSEKFVMQTREKLKLQLFPIDEDTRRRLHKDSHNPFLELTLSARKRISSVLEHLNRKWSIDTIGSGELLLLPYGIQEDDMAKCQRWSIKDADSTAADVHAAIGNPSVFRLRYGWFSGAEHRAEFSDFPVAPGSEDRLHSDGSDASNKRFIASSAENATVSISCNSTLLEGPCTGGTLSPSVIGGVGPGTQGGCLVPKDGLNESYRKSPSSSAETTKGNCRNQQNVVDPVIRNSSDLLAGEWADSLTNISVGDLLLEASEASSPEENTFDIHQNLASCDSFDAAVAAQSYGPRFTGLPPQAPVASIWNVEETCDEFSFKMASALKAKCLNLCPNISHRIYRDTVANSSGAVDCYFEDLKEPGPPNDPPGDVPESDNNSAFYHKQEPAKDVSFTDLYWPDSLGSLGQLDMDLSFSRYQTQDLCFSENISQSSFNRTISGSLDLFHNGSFLGADKRDTTCEVEENTALDKMGLEN